MVTLVLILFISLLWTCGTETDYVASNEKKTVINKIDFLTLDESEIDEDAGADCSCFSFTILETIVIGVLCVGFALLLVRLILWCKGNYLKRKEKLEAEAERREQEIRNRLLS